MALVAPVLEQTYRYPLPSALVGEGDRRRLRLATSGGPVANPQFFRGRLLLPVVAADLLLTLGDVARSRFHVPAQMLKGILELADPVVTCADDRLRFEAFSACCSVYGRVDLLPEAYDGEILGRGTTNVDFGPGIRAALAGVRGSGRLGLSVGASAVEVQADGGSAVERRVPLPSRWLRGFLEVQVIQAELALFAELGASGARAFLRSIPKSPSQRPVWLGSTGRDLRLLHHDPGGGAPGLAGLARLRLFERVARHATGLRVFAAPGDGSTGWQLDVPGARLTLVLSPDIWRGFSGEGRALHRLADGCGRGRGRRGPRCARLGASVGHRRPCGNDWPDGGGGVRGPGGPGRVRHRRLRPRGRWLLPTRAALRPGSHGASAATTSGRAAAGRAGGRPHRRRQGHRTSPHGSPSAAGIDYRVRSRPTAGRAPARGTAVTAAIGDRASTCSRSSSLRPMTPAETLRAAGRAGDEAAVRDLLVDLSEVERADLIPVTRELVAADMQQGIAAVGHLGPMLLAAYGVLPVSDIRKLGWRANHLPDRLEIVLRRRSPDRLGPIIEYLLDEAGGRAWPSVRALVREGSVPRPERPSYTIAMLAATRYRRAADLVAEDPGLLEVEVWRLFEVEGGGEDSLANHEKFFGDTWGTFFRERAATDAPMRQRLLEASLAALARDFSAYRAGWYSRFHESLAPTDDERAQHADAYLRLLRSRIGPTVSFAVAALARISRSGRLAPDALLDRIGPVLVDGSAGTAKAGLDLVGRAGAGSPDAARRAALAATDGLANASPDVQRAAITLIGRLVSGTGRSCRAGCGRPLRGPGKLTADGGHGADRPPWRGPGRSRRGGDRVRRFRDRRHPSRSSVAPDRTTSPMPSPIDAARAIEPLTSFESLVDVAVSVLETGEPADDLERVMDAVGRLADTRPEAVSRLAAPHRQTCPGDPGPAGELPVQRLRPDGPISQASSWPGRRASSSNRAQPARPTQAPAASCLPVPARSARRPASAVRSLGSLPRRTPAAGSIRSCSSSGSPRGRPRRASISWRPSCGWLQLGEMPPCCRRGGSARRGVRRPALRARWQRIDRCDRRLVGGCRPRPGAGTGRCGGGEAPSTARSRCRAGCPDPVVGAGREAVLRRHRP